MTAAHYTLWGTPHSLYTGKARSYLIKKGLPWRERRPAEPHFAAEVLPKVGMMVIPVLETAEGEVVQENCDIIDLLEARHPEPSLAPPGPVQQVVAHFLDAFGSNYFLPLAMHYRWSYRAEQELFLRSEFARVLPRMTSHAERLELAGKVMERFNGFLPNLGVTPEVIPALEAAWLDMLAVLEAHFREWPYLLGGRPSLADFGLMAPLFAHLGRDPVPARLMKTHAPAVFRWTERMNTPGIADPDFPHVAPEWPADDALPETLEAVLKEAFAQWTPGMLADAAQFDAWLAGLDDPAAGTPVSHDGRRQVHPHVGRIEYGWRGVTVRRAGHPHSLWHLARAQDAARALVGEDAARLAALLDRTDGSELMAVRTSRRIVRADNILVLA